ncbi:DNA translocase FtsK [Striga asiatica]|uniref:DNA translocase FtsK n=1 Tax=Striga asiatica TaxID=4170 RepID=A0A5A7Q787_STRAF|nr:DNA translocase FtsK [Striga asiatica]
MSTYNFRIYRQLHRAPPQSDTVHRSAPADTRERQCQSTPFKADHASQIRRRRRPRPVGEYELSRRRRRPRPAGEYELSRRRRRPRPAEKKSFPAGEDDLVPPANLRRPPSPWIQSCHQKSDWRR